MVGMQIRNDFAFGFYCREFHTYMTSDNIHDTFFWTLAALSARVLVSLETLIADLPPEICRAFPYKIPLSLFCLIQPPIGFFPMA